MVRIKNEKLKMYGISNEYKEYLIKYDKKVSLKENRKFYGIIVTKDEFDYYIPFSSKSNKNTNSKVTVNIKNNKKVIAKLLLNNMIPVNIKDSYIVDVENSKYKTYYMNELRYLHSKKVEKEIIKKIDNIFNVLKNKNHYDYLFFKSICCNFKLLEQKCKEYNNEIIA